MRIRASRLPFCDRFTDLVTTRKELGRQFDEKSAFLPAVGADNELPRGFQVPFQLTSKAFNMTYHTCLYYATKAPLPKAALKSSRFL